LAPCYSWRKYILTRFYVCWRDNTSHSKSEVFESGLGGQNGIVTGGGFDIGVADWFTVVMSAEIYWNAQGGPLNRSGK
jgi:hypothetical protein